MSLNPQSSILNPPDCSFLGVDYTTGPDWRSAFGREAWILFACQEAEDLCGGPRLLEGTFSYSVRLGDPDPKNGPRRWRSQKEAWGAFGGILPLCDPADPGVRHIAFLDDNGESYPPGCGPDLYLDLRIPSGPHILSLPVLFSDSKGGKAAYAFYLSRIAGGGESPEGSLSAPAGDGADARGPVGPVAAFICPWSLGAGCVVRASVQGPGHFRLLLRRLNSHNVNLPALFLDPDPRFSGAAALDKNLSPDDLRAAGLHVQTLSEGLPEVDSSGPGAVAALLDIARQYAAADAAIAILENPERGSGSNADLAARAAAYNWTRLAERAGTLAESTAIPGAPRAVAAWIAFRSCQHDPLHTGHISPALAGFLSLYSASPSPNSPFPPASPVTSKDSASLIPAPPVTVAGARSQPSDSAALLKRTRFMQPFEGELRRQGLLGLAEQVDDSIWDDQIRLAEITVVPGLRYNLPAQEKLLNDLWLAGPHYYLARQTAWIWRGEGLEPPELVFLALDAGYTARKAAEITRGLLTSGRSLAGFLATAAPAIPIQYDDIGAQRARFYLIRLDHTPAELGLSVTPSGRRGGATSGAPLEQPVGLIVFSAACQPLLGDADPALPPSLRELAGPDTSVDGVFPGKPYPPLPHSNLLDPIRLEHLARAWLDRDLYPTGRERQDRARATILLSTLRHLFPAYDRRAQVAALLASLPPVPSQ